MVEDREISICVWMIIEILIGPYTQDDGKLVIIQTYLEIERIRFRSDPERSYKWIACTTFYFASLYFVDLKYISVGWRRIHSLPNAPSLRHMSLEVIY